MRPTPSDIIERTTYLVSTIGDSVLTRTSSSICELCIMASAPSWPTAALLTRPKSGPKSLRRPFDQTGNFVDLAEVERHEMQRPVLGPFGLGDGVA